MIEQSKFAYSPLGKKFCEIKKITSYVIESLDLCIKKMN